MAITFEEFGEYGIRITDHDDDARLRLYATEALQVRDELLRRYPLEKAEALKPAEPAPLSLEVGKWYRRRDGKVVQIVSADESPTSMLFGTKGGLLYRPNGNRMGETQPTKEDLLSETSPPEVGDTSPEQKHIFGPGDVVRIDSNGVLSTICSVWPNGDLYVYHVDGGKVIHRTFAPSDVTLIDSRFADRPIAEVPAPGEVDECNLSPDSIEPVSQEVQDRINLQRDAGQARGTKLPPSLTDAKADGVGLRCESHDSARAFKVGDVVRLKTGGPKMTIRSRDANSWSCIMCDASGLKSHSLPEDVLVHADEKPSEDESAGEKAAATAATEKPAWTPPTLEESYASLQRAYEKTDAAFARKCEEYSVEREKRFELEARLNEALASHAKLEAKIRRLESALKALIGE